jgi:hypothetical protein
MKFASQMRDGLTGLMALAALATVSAPAATTRDDQPDNDYLALGALADFASVGSFVNSWGYAGSGILIASDWVLTAAHMLDAATSGTFTINGISYGSSQIFKNPGWTGNVLNGNDYGLVHLTAPVSAVSPALFFTGSVETNHVGTFVGFGFKGTGLTGWKTLDGQKRAFQNMIDGDFGNPYLLLGADFDNPNNPADNWFGSALPQTLEGCVAPGDSGGGVFVQQGGYYYLAGVVSGVLATDGNANSDYGDITAYGRVSAAMPWINSVMGVPEPSTYALLLAGGAMVFCLRCRR